MNLTLGFRDFFGMALVTRNHHIRMRTRRRWGLYPLGFSFVRANESIAIGTEPEIPWFVVDQGAAMLAGHDGLVFVARVTVADVDPLAALIMMVFDATVKTEVFLWFPGCVVKTE